MDGWPRSRPSSAWWWSVRTERRRGGVVTKGDGRLARARTVARAVSPWAPWSALSGPGSDPSGRAQVLPYHRNASPTHGASISSHVHSWQLQVLRTKTTVFRDSSQHAWSDLLAVVEREYEVSPADSSEDAVGATASLDGPAHTDECSEHARCARAWPVAHAAAKEISR